MGFLRRVLSAAVAELQRQGAVKERERARLEAEAYGRALAAAIRQRLEDLEDVAARTPSSGNDHKGLN